MRVLPYCKIHSVYLEGTPWINAGGHVELVDMDCPAGDPDCYNDWELRIITQVGRRYSVNVCGHAVNSESFCTEMSCWNYVSKRRR